MLILPKLIYKVNADPVKTSVDFLFYFGQTETTFYVEIQRIQKNQKGFKKEEQNWKTSTI